MVIYDVLCASAHRSEVVQASMHDDAPRCPACGDPTRRVPAAARLSGRASAGPSREQMPHTWTGIRRGDPETVRTWHALMSTREKLEEKYPELAGDRRPVLAHEGAFAGAPLTAGDPMAASVARAAFGTLLKSSPERSPTTFDPKKAMSTHAKEAL